MTESLQPHSVGTTSSSQGLKGFITELRQRNVFKVAVAYAITGWLIIEVVNNTFPVFEFPRWTSQFAILLVLLGFPVALVFAWIFEITPEGLRATATAHSPPAFAAAQSQKLNTVIVGLIGVAVTFLFVDRFYLSDSAPTAPAAPVTAVSGTPRLSVVLPARQPLSIVAWPSSSLALSPDGSTLVYSGENRDLPADRAGGRKQLFQRTLDSRTISALPETFLATQPFFAPDGQSVGFFTGDGALKKVALSGGAPVTLVEGLLGGAWSFGVWTDEDEIVFSDRTTLYRIPAAGGTPEQLTTLNADSKELTHIFPSLVPGKRAVLFTVNSEPPFERRIEALLLDSGERRVVLDNASSAHVLSSGHVLFQRDTTVMLAPFDFDTLTVSGPAVPVPEAIGMDNAALPYPQAQLTVAPNGVLAYMPEVTATGELGTLTPGGSFESFGLGADYYEQPRVAPDGRTLSFLLKRDRESVLYGYDLERGTTARLSQDGARVSAVAWRPDGSGMAVAVFLNGVSLLENGSQSLLLPPEVGIAKGNMNWTPDGRQLVYTRQQGEQHDLWVHDMDGAQADRPIVAGPERELDPVLSPDGKWLAYTSRESGRYEVYIQAYPTGSRYTVSREGGGLPLWSADGSALYFIGLQDDTQKMLQVAVTAAATELRLGTPEALFDMRQSSPDGTDFRYERGYNSIGAGYDILPDGRFVLIRSPIPENREIVIVQNWFDEVRRLAPLPAPPQ